MTFCNIFIHHKWFSPKGTVRQAKKRRRGAVPYGLVCNKAPFVRVILSGVRQDSTFALLGALRVRFRFASLRMTRRTQSNTECDTQCRDLERGVRGAWDIGTREGLAPPVKQNALPAPLHYVKTFFTKRDKNDTPCPCKIHTGRGPTIILARLSASV